MNTYFKNIATILLTVAWFFGSQYIATLLMANLMGIPYVQEHTFFVTLIAYGICLLPYIQTIKTFKIDKPYHLEGIGQIFRYIGYGILLWLASCVINGILLPFFPTYTQEIDTLFVTNEPVLRFLVLVIGAPLLEEYIFRGKIQDRLETLFGRELAIVGQGVIFGVVHPFGLQKVYASVLGIGLGYVRDKNQTLIGPTIMHMTINGIAWLLATFVM
ncbi:MAG: lysostaphin resistance A-like protein [Cellulosilyticaceae bacterium]